jgi:hypothetical protein
MNDIRIALDKINHIELCEGFDLGSKKRIPIRHIDTAIEDINTAKQWIQQAIKSSAILDMNSNVASERFFQKKLTSALRDAEKLKATLNEIASFIEYNTK